MPFEFATAGRILFGPGVIDQLVPLVKAYGTRVLLVSGVAEERSQPLLEKLEAGGLDCLRYHIPEEPTTLLAVEGKELAVRSEREVVIGFGGGSGIDGGKAIAALATNPGDPLDYLEVVGAGKALVSAPLPFIAIPTTAGTGAEVTRNAVLASPEHRVKVSLRSSSMLPKIALVDPALTYSMPPAVTASTGMDALTQVIEPFVSNRANPLTDSLCREGIQRGARSLWKAYHDGQDTAAREDMSLTSLFGGLALANAGLGVVHGFAGPVGGQFKVPHGAVCAALLPYCMQANIQALKERQPESPALQRYQEVARLLTGSSSASLQDGVEWVVDLNRRLGIPSLSSMGLSEGDIPQLVEKSAQASSMKANPIVLRNEELTEILQRAM